jgi:hypothetical protein
MIVAAPIQASCRARRAQPGHQSRKIISLNHFQVGGRPSPMSMLGASRARQEAVVSP